MPAKKSGSGKRTAFGKNAGPSKTARAAEQKFGKAAFSAKRSGKKPVVWQKTERTQMPGALPLPLPTTTHGDPAPRGTPDNSVMRTIDATASEAFRAFNDPARRSWCHEQGYAVRASAAPRSLVLGFTDGSVARVNIARKGNSRVLVTVTLDGATPATASGAWRASLERLGDLLQ